MKNTLLLLTLVLGMSAAFAQEDTRPVNTGDNFSLEGALAMFKNATSLEAFEKLLNEESNNVNNLDLNDDGDIDYITVTDMKEGNSHVIVLSTFLANKEKQDIATIGIEKTGDATAVLQIEGDTDLYPANTIVEPIDEKEVIIKGSKGPSADEVEVQVVIVNVWLWPCVQFMYAPAYVVWVSPYYWGYYPRWWRPWRPWNHPVFYAHCAPHRLYYRPVTTRRVVVAHRAYTPNRHSSTLVVHNRRGTTVIHRNPRGGVRATTVPRTPSRGIRNATTPRTPKTIRRR